MSYKQLLIIATAAVLTLTTSYATAAIDITAPIIQLRKSCSEAGNVLNNCFSDLNSMGSWIWNTRKPSGSAPLLVEIGPGTFNGNYSCVNSGYVTLRGSGPSQTKIMGGWGFVTSNNCTQLNFEDLTLEGINNGAFTPVIWSGGGTSRWSNVDMITYGYGWVEQNCGVAPGQHYWLGSRILAYGSTNSLRNYVASCDVTWFIGSEITSTFDAPSSAATLNVLFATGNSEKHGEIHVYGSVIRALSRDNVFTRPASAGEGFSPIVATGNGEIHIHGSAIDAISISSNQVVVISAESSGMVHANTASYNLKTGAGGSITRVFGHVHAPYSWQPHAEPPFTNDGVSFTSQEGADTAVVTNTVDGFPHPIIYTTKCTSKWFDIVTKTCR